MDRSGTSAAAFVVKIAIWPTFASVLEASERKMGTYLNTAFLF